MVRHIAAGVLLVVLLLAGSAFGPPPAQAGTPEQIVQVAVKPGDPSMMVVRLQNYGDDLLYTRDAGRTFRLICGSAIKESSKMEPPLAKLGTIGIGGDGTMLMGVFGGLWRDDGAGCAWTRETLTAGRWITDVVPHPRDPNITFFITSNGGDIENGVLRRNADGTLTELGTKKAMLITRLRVVELPGGGLRFYESGVARQVATLNEVGAPTTKPSYMIRVSDDEGSTWVEHEIGIVDGALRLEAVDPANPDRIVVNLARDVDGRAVPDQLLISSDQGATLQEWTTVTQLTGIVFTRDGEVWIGDGGHSGVPDAPRGLLRAASLGEAPVLQTNDFRVSCLDYAGDDMLLVCQEHSFGRFSMTDLVFTPSIELTKVEELHECAGMDSAQICRQQLCTGYCGMGHFTTAPMCIEEYGSTDMGCAPLLPIAGGAGGASGASGMSGLGVGGAAGDAPPPSMSTDRGCGCAAVGSRSSTPSPYAALGLLAGALFVARRKSRLARIVS